MSEPTTTTPGQIDVAAEILRMAPEQDGGATTPETSPGPLSPAVPPAESGSAAQPGEQPAAPRSVTTYYFTWPEPIHDKHRKIVEEIKALPGEETWKRLQSVQPISPRGRQRGCQCVECKSARGELFIVEAKTSGAPADAEVVETFLGELLDLDENLIGEFITMPKEAIRFVLEKKGFPKEAVNAWETSQKRLQAYNKFGRRVVDRYLKLPDFKHKELVALGVLMFIDYAKAGQQTLLAIRLSEKTK